MSKILTDPTFQSSSSMKWVFLRFLTFYLVTDLSRLAVKLFTSVLLWTCYIINHVFKNSFENIQNTNLSLISIFLDDSHEIKYFKALRLNHFVDAIMSVSYLSLDCSSHFVVRGRYRIWHIYCYSWKDCVTSIVFFNLHVPFCIAILKCIVTKSDGNCSDH